MKRTKCSVQNRSDIRSYWPSVEWIQEKWWSSLILIVLLAGCASPWSSPPPSPHTAAGATPSPTTSSRLTGSPVTVSTFQSIGIYWSPADGSAANLANVQYRASGTSIWKNGTPLWWDGRALNGTPPEYRGSIVNLSPGITYEIQLKLATGTIVTTSATTWSETFPVSQTIIIPSQTLSSSYTITQSGTANGYVLYTAASGGTMLNGNNTVSDCMVINGASYIIIRGLTIKNCAKNGIYLIKGAHHIVIENNDISNWGRICSDGWGYDKDSGVYSNYSNIHNIIVQRNKIHNPRSNSNNWEQSRSSSCTSNSANHPEGPRAVGFFSNSQGNNVIRYNEAWGDANHYFADIFGGGANFSYGGFPGPNSDIYGNKIQHSWDNPLEIEGGGMNVRVWGNYMEDSYSPSIAAVSMGPLYWFRNIQNRSRYGTSKTSDDDPRGRFFKAGGGLKNSVIYNGGRVYFFHNTALQQNPPTGSLYPLGISIGIDGNQGSNGGSLYNLVSRNNILQVYKSTGNSITVKDINNDIDNDLYNGTISGPSGNTFEAHGIKGVPTYQSFDLNQLHFALSSSSLGYDKGILLPNFNDDYKGAAPDIGAQEANAPWLEFGVNAYEK